MSDKPKILYVCKDQDSLDILYKQYQTLPTFVDVMYRANLSPVHTPCSLLRMTNCDVTFVTEENSVRYHYGTFDSVRFQRNNAPDTVISKCMATVPETVRTMEDVDILVIGNDKLSLTSYYEKINTLFLARNTINHLYDHISFQLHDFCERYHFHLQLSPSVFSLKPNFYDKVIFLNEIDFLQDYMTDIQKHCVKQLDTPSMTDKPKIDTDVKKVNILVKAKSVPEMYAFDAIIKNSPYHQRPTLTKDGNGVASRSLYTSWNRTETEYHYQIGDCAVEGDFDAIVAATDFSVLPKPHTHIQPAPSTITKPNYNHYFKDVSHLDSIDVYRVLKLFDVTDPAIQHAVKKLLCSGVRGHKDRNKDWNEAIVSIQRAIRMSDEDESVKSDPTLTM